MWQEVLLRTDSNVWSCVLSVDAISPFLCFYLSFSSCKLVAGILIYENNKNIILNIYKIDKNIVLYVPRVWHSKKKTKIVWM
jgi:hypothetical protein